MKKKKKKRMEWIGWGAEERKREKAKTVVGQAATLSN